MRVVWRAEIICSLKLIQDDITGYVKTGVYIYIYIQGVPGGM